jgi:hypothetical protein
MVRGGAPPSVIRPGKHYNSRYRRLAILQVPVKQVDSEASSAVMCSLRAIKDGIVRIAHRGLPEPGFAGRDVEVALLAGEGGGTGSCVAAAMACRSERVGANPIFGLRLESVALEVSDPGACVS